MVCRAGWCFLSVTLARARFQKAFSHFLHARIVVRLGPCELLHIKFKIAPLYRPMIPFANIRNVNQSRNIVFFRILPISRRRQREAHGVPLAVWRRPRAAAGIAQIAECFDDMLRRSFIFVLRSGTAASPSSTQRQTRRMRPASVFQSFNRHEIGTGQVSSPQDSDLPGRAIVTTGRGL